MAKFGTLRLFECSNGVSLNSHGQFNSNFFLEYDQREFGDLGIVKNSNRVGKIVTTTFTGYWVAFPCTRSKMDSNPSAGTPSAKIKGSLRTNRTRVLKQARQSIGLEANLNGNNVN